MRIREHLPRAVLAIGWLLGLAYAYPGVMTYDSCDQLTEARANYYTDGHPPILAKLWHYVDAILPGPFGMLVIQTAAFVIGLDLVLRRTLAPLPSAIATVLIFLFPPVLTVMAVIWKDAPMAGFFLLGIAGLLSERRGPRIWGLVAIAFATAVRYNAFAASVPLVVLLFVWTPAAPYRSSRLPRRDDRLTSWLKRYALSLAVAIGVTGVALGVDAALVDVNMHYWQSSLALLDISGTIDHLDPPPSDDELRRTLAGTHLLVDHDIAAAIHSQYVPWNFDSLVSADNPGHLWNVPFSGTTPAPADQNEAIARAFWEIVEAHPGAYLRHRWQVTAELLGITNYTSAKLMRGHRNQYAGYLQNLQLSTEWSPTQDALERRMFWLGKHTPFFEPWIYVLISLLLLPLALRHRDVLALLLSGLGIEASLFFLAPTPDFRYSHWMVICTIVSVIILAVRRARAGKLRDKQV
jgi:hypothetical protein